MPGHNYNVPSYLAELAAELTQSGVTLQKLANLNKTSLCDGKDRMLRHNDAHGLVTHLRDRLTKLQSNSFQTVCLL